MDCAVETPPRSRQSGAQRLKRSPTVQLTNTNITRQEDAVKTKLKATLAAAVVIALALIAGWIDNDYHDQRAQERTECAWIRTPDGTSICR